METRKIQQVGGGTFTVSLPKAWTTEHDFEAGMELRLYTQRDGSILIRSSEADIECLADATIELDNCDPEAAARAVRTAHTVGFENITVRRNGEFTDAERDAVQSTVRELVGTNILAASDTEITIRHLLDSSSVSVRQSVIQLQYVVVSLLRDSAEMFVEGTDIHVRIRDRAAEARRSVGMVKRHFARSLISYAELDALGVSLPELFAYYGIATRLETVIEQAARIANTGATCPEPPSDAVDVDVCSVVDDVACAIDDAVTAVLNGDMAKGQQARDRCDDAIERIDAVEQRLYNGAVSDPAAAIALATRLTHLRRAANCSCSMADIAARTAIRAENLDL